jgi:hypothetical protein
LLGAALLLARAVKHHLCHLSLLLLLLLLLLQVCRGQAPAAQGCCSRTAPPPAVAPACRVMARS